MAFNLGGENRDDEPVTADINVKPLVDVMLVLAIIFMIAAPMLPQPDHTALLTPCALVGAAARAAAPHHPGPPPHPRRCAPWRLAPVPPRALAGLRDPQGGRQQCGAGPPPPSACPGNPRTRGLPPNRNR